MGRNLDRIYYAAQKLICRAGESLEMFPKEKWFNSILPSGEPTRLGLGYQQTPCILAAASGGSNQHYPGKDIVRYDEKDYPNVYNIDHYETIENLTIHSKYHQILDMAQVEDSEFIRIELQKYVFSIGPKKLPHHHSQEIPKAIKDAKPKPDNESN